MNYVLAHSSVLRGIVSCQIWGAEKFVYINLLPSDAALSSTPPQFFVGASPYVNNVV